MKLHISFHRREKIHAAKVAHVFSRIKNQWMGCGISDFYSQMKTRWAKPTAQTVRGKKWAEKVTFDNLHLLHLLLCNEIARNLVYEIM